MFLGFCQELFIEHLLCAGNFPDTGDTEVNKTVGTPAREEFTSWEMWGEEQIYLLVSEYGVYYTYMLSGTTKSYPEVK